MKAALKNIKLLIFKTNNRVVRNSSD